MNSKFSIPLGDTKQLNVFYTLCQTFYWVGFLFLVNYQGNFLLEHGFSNTEVGFVFALTGILTVIFQYLLSYITDRYAEKPISFIVMILLICNAVIILGIYLFESSHIMLFIFFVLLGAIYASISPLINSINVRFVNEGYALNFSQARGLASFFYAGITFFFSFFITRVGVRRMPALGLITLALSFIMMLVMRQLELQIPPRVVDEQDIEESAGEKQRFQIFKKYTGFFLILMVLALVFMGHNYFYAFLIQTVRSIGGDDQSMAYILAIGAFFETIAMLSYVNLRHHFKAHQLFFASLTGVTLKLLMQALVPSIPLLMVAQILQGLGNGLFLPSSVEYINNCMLRKDEVRGQLYIGMATYLGYVLASLTGGLVIDLYGAYTQRWVAFVISSIGLILAMIGVPKLNESAKRKLELARKRIAQQG